VAVMSRNRPEWVYFDQAAMRRGLLTVPLYHTDSAGNIAYIIADCGAKLLLIEGRETWEKIRPEVEKLKVLERILVIEHVEDLFDHRLMTIANWLKDAADGKREPLDEDAAATIVYTSGTTGKPKGVMLSHRNIMTNAYLSLQRVKVLTSDRLLSFLPLSHTFERTAGYYLPMMAGASVVFARSIALLGEDFESVKPTVFIAVPRIFERVKTKIEAKIAQEPPLKRRLFKFAVETGWSRFQRKQGRNGWTAAQILWPLLNLLVARKVLAKLGGKVRLAVSGGAPLPLSAAKLFIGLGLNLIQGYGMTETSPVICANSVDGNDPASVGPPIPLTRVRLGKNGELEARGPGAMKGYWNNPAATAAIFTADGWLKTGDVAMIDNGKVYITGRIKDIIVLSSGEKAPPAEQEAAIVNDPLFDKAVIIGEGRPYMTAIVALTSALWREEAAKLHLNPDNPAAASDPRFTMMAHDRIAKAVNAFPEYAKVKRVLFTTEEWTVDNGLLTPTMKIKRGAVIERYTREIDWLYGERKAA